ncbi:uncharacterized protein BXZ73DRAFT_43126, partial [Epithele typhae]|uniref:uncharacterized protein n=1 Tax=Epithele typhae TaxID=378194 RepID=UPI002008CF10
VERELAAVREGARQTAALLETRSTELRAAQVFLTRADDVPDSDVVRLVENLNASVFQIAAAIADTFQSRCGGRNEGAEDACVELKGRTMLPEGVTDALRHVDHRKDGTLVQFALQTVMATYAREVGVLWDTRGKSDFERVYESIRAHEPQAVAGRWRTLCRTHLRALREDEDEQRAEAARILVSALATVLRACGVADERDAPENELRLAHSDALHAVVSIAFEFRRVAGEVIVSREFAVVMVMPEQPFDESAMEDEWEGPKKKRRRGHEAETAHPVFCTTGLGLVREENGSEGGRVLLVKPKVILTSIVDKLQEEGDGGR